MRQLAHGRFLVQAVDAQNRVQHDYGWQTNLILNQGMDGLVERSWASSFEVLAVGTGSTPNYLSSGSTNASQTNVTVTLTGGSLRFTSTTVDRLRMIKWDTGEEAQIITVQSATTCTVADSKIKLATPFRLYLTDQTGLAAEVKRSNAYFTLLPGNGTVVTPPNQLVMVRVFHFLPESSDATYTEAGVSWSTSPGANLFSRILFDAPVVIGTDLKLRITYALTLTLLPAMASVKTANISGWPLSPATNTQGSAMLEDWGLYGVSGSGSTVPLRTVNGVPIVANEPFGAAQGLASSDNQALIAPGQTPLNRCLAPYFSKALLLDPYQLGQYSRTKTFPVSSNESNSNSIRSLSIGHMVDTGNFLPVFTFLLDQDQKKVSPNILRLTFKYSWGRVLS